jgi:hypothetical protein
LVTIFQTHLARTLADVSMKDATQQTVCHLVTLQKMTSIQMPTFIGMNVQFALYPSTKLPTFPVLKQPKILLSIVLIADVLLSQQKIMFIQ